MLILHSLVILNQSVSYPPVGYQKLSLTLHGQAPSNVRFEVWNKQVSDEACDEFIFAWKDSQRFSYHLIKDGFEVNSKRQAGDYASNFPYRDISPSQDGTFFGLDRKVDSQTSSCHLFNIGKDGIHQWLKGADISTVFDGLKVPKKGLIRTGKTGLGGFDKTFNLTFACRFEDPNKVGHPRVSYVATFNVKTLKATPWKLEE